MMTPRFWIPRASYPQHAAIWEEAFGSARSLDPIMILEHAKSYIAAATDAELPPE
jgi:hypothetical protein